MNPGKTIACCACLLLLACEPAPPTNLIAPGVMEDILVQMHIADAYTERTRDPLAERNVARRDLYYEILDKYQLTDSAFYRSYRYYVSQPVQMDSMYQRVLLRLEGMQAQIQMEENPDTPVPEPAEGKSRQPTRAPWQNPDQFSQE